MSTKLVLSGTASFAIGAAAAKAFGMLRDAYVARAFGLSDQVDAYLMAQALALLPLNVIFLALQPILTASLAGATRHRATLRVPRDVARAIKLGFLALAVFALLTWVALPTLLKALTARADGALIEATRSAYRWVIAGAFCSAASTLGYGALYARGRLFVGGLLPLLVPLGMVAVLIVAPGPADASRLGAALSAGYLGEAVVVLFVLFRHDRYRVDAHASTAKGALSRQALALMTGMVLMGATPFVEQSFALGLGPGAVSTLGFGSRVPLALSGIVGTAVSASFLPIIASQLATGAAGGALRTFRMTTGIVLAGGLCTSLLLLILSRYITEVLFVGGRFSATDASAVSSVQAILGFGIPAATIAAIGARVLVARSAAAMQAAIPAATLLAVVGLNILLVPRMGVTGIAVSSVLSACFNSVLVMVTADTCLRKTRLLPSDSTART